jgi:hypothetical protein
MNGGTEENHKNLSEDIRCPGEDLNRSLQEHMSRMLPSRQTWSTHQPHAALQRDRQTE